MIQVQHIKLEPGEILPRLPKGRPYVAVIVAHEDSEKFWQNGVAEALAVGDCVMACVYGRAADEWAEVIEQGYTLSQITEERCHSLPPLEVWAHQNAILDDVFDAAARGIQESELEDISLVIVFEIGEPLYSMQLHRTGMMALGNNGLRTAVAC